MASLSKETMSKFSENLSAYRSACEEHPELKSFDSSLQQRTNKVIDSLTSGAKNGVLSQTTVHKHISGHLLEVSQDVANCILKSENNMWENNATKELVKAYFENTVKTLEIFGYVKGCVEKAEICQHIILAAVAQFDKESAEKDVGVKKKRYEKTLKELKKFQAMGDPFDGSDLKAQFKLIIEQQKSLLEKVSEAKTKIDAEIKELAGEIDVISNVLFAATFCIVVVGLVVLTATGVGAPAVAAGLVEATVSGEVAGVLELAAAEITGEVALPGIAIGWAGICTLLENRMDNAKKHQEYLTRVTKKLEEVEVATETEEVAMETVSVLANNLEKTISSLIDRVNDGTGEEYDEVLIVSNLDSIKKLANTVTDEIKELGETVDKHTKLILEARINVLEKINGSGKYHRG